MTPEVRRMAGRLRHATQGPYGRQRQRGSLCWNLWRAVPVAAAACPKPMQGLPPPVSSRSVHRSESITKKLIIYRKMENAYMYHGSSCVHVLCLRSFGALPLPRR